MGVVGGDTDQSGESGDRDKRHVLRQTKKWKRFLKQSWRRCDKKSKWEHQRKEHTARRISLEITSLFTIDLSTEANSHSKSLPMPPPPTTPHPPQLSQQLRATSPAFTIMTTCTKLCFATTLITYITLSLIRYSTAASGHLEKGVD